MNKRATTLAILALAATGCGGSHGGGGGFEVTAVSASTSSTLGAAPFATVNGNYEVLPVVLIHGHGGSPADWKPFLARYGRGFVTVPALYAKEADQLRAGDLPIASVVAAGYYKESESGSLYDMVQGVGTDSIGGCPVPRTDGNAGLYPNSYVERIGRIVDDVRRATGSDRVDLVCHSMGNLVGRAYTKWHSSGARGGLSKVRRICGIAGPQRGLDALDSFVDGVENGGARSFMLQGENAEMCYELGAWQGHSWIYWLNQDWDGFCTANGVRYAGITGTGAFGPQVQSSQAATAGTAGSAAVASSTPTGSAPSVAPPPPAAGPLASFQSLLKQLTPVTYADAAAYIAIVLPNLANEAQISLGPSDGTVLVSSSCMDLAPFLGRDFYATFEGRHSQDWNVEQTTNGSTFTAELARQYLLEPSLPSPGTLQAASLALVDAPGKASWVELTTSVAGGPLVSAQVVEERLDAQGNVVGGATGYGVPVVEGEEHVLLAVPSGGGTRRYHLVVYGTHGPEASLDETFSLTSGSLEVAPVTTCLATAVTPGPQGPIVAATFGSNAVAPALAFSFRFDEGPWTSWAWSPVFTTPPLAPGEHRLDARSQHGDNAAGIVTDDTRGVSLGIYVDPSGRVTIRD
jgi:pimeloyl-ACP methyl ester carboxylesterase